MNRVFLRHSSLNVAILTITVGLALSSCSLVKVEEFGKAATSGITAAESTYRAFDDEYVVARSTTASLRGKLQPGDFRPLLSEEDNRYRSRLLLALGDYTKSLERLASKDIAGETATSTAELKTSLTNLSSSYAHLTDKQFPLSNAQIGVLGTIFQSAATATLEYQRKQAIKKIVTEANPAIQTVALELPQEITSMGRNLNTNMTRAENSLIEAFNTADASGTLGYSERLHLREIIDNYRKRRANVLPVFQASAKATKEIGAAHQALADAVREGKFSSEEFLKQIQILQTTVAEIKSYYGQIDTKK